MMRSVPIVAAVLMIAGAIALPGCGQKGPLYLRDNPPPGVKPPRPAPYEPVPYPESTRDARDAPSR